MPLNSNLNVIQIFFLSFGTFLFDFSIFFIIFSLSAFISLPQVFEQSSCPILYSCGR